MEVEVKVNQTNSIAAIEYSKGVSLIHFSLFIAWFYVIHPDIEYASTFEDIKNKFGDCRLMTEEADYLLNLLLVNHIICMVVCFLNEVLGTVLGWRGKMLRTLDIVTVLLNFFVYMEVVCALFKFHGFKSNSNLGCYEA